MQKERHLLSAVRLVKKIFVVLMSCHMSKIKIVSKFEIYASLLRASCLRFTVLC